MQLMRPVTSPQTSAKKISKNKRKRTRIESSTPEKTEPKLAKIDIVEQAQKMTRSSEKKRRNAAKKKEAMDTMEAESGETPTAVNTDSTGAAGNISNGDPNAAAAEEVGVVANAAGKAPAVAQPGGRNAAVRSARGDTGFGILKKTTQQSITTLFTRTTRPAAAAAPPEDLVPAATAADTINVDIGVAGDSSALAKALMALAGSMSKMQATLEQEREWRRKDMEAVNVRIDNIEDGVVNVSEGLVRLEARLEELNVHHGIGTAATARHEFALRDADFRQLQTEIKLVGVNYDEHFGNGKESLRHHEMISWLAVVMNENREQLDKIVSGFSQLGKAKVTKTKGGADRPRSAPIIVKFSNQGYRGEFRKHANKIKPAPWKLHDSALPRYEGIIKKLNDKRQAEEAKGLWARVRYYKDVDCGFRYFLESKQKDASSWRKVFQEPMFWEAEHLTF